MTEKQLTIVRLHNRIGPARITYRASTDHTMHPSAVATSAEVRGALVLSQTYPAVPQSLAAVRATIGRFATKAGAPQAMIDRVKLAVSEAAMNVIVHAYRESGDRGLIYLEANLQGTELQVSVADMGSGLRSRDDSPGLGLGLAIINRLADKIELLQGGQGGLRILMRFALRTRAG